MPRNTDLLDDSDWNSPEDRTLVYGDNPTLCARIRKQAANIALPYDTQVTLYLAAARIEWLAGQAQAKGD